MSANRKYSPDNPVGFEIALARTFDAPRELVFRAWTEEAQVREWWAPEGFTNPVCKVDPRVGGLMDIHMRAPDGTIYPMKATFNEIVPNERIVFTASALDDKGDSLFDVLTTVIFAGTGNTTQLTLTARVLNARSEGAHHIGGMEMGWSGSLDKLVDYIKKIGKPIMTTSKKSAGENTADREIVISRDFDALRELVWEAWTNPEHVAQWWGPQGFSTDIEVMDVRVGGVWKHVMRGPDGTEFPNQSIFTEVVKPERISYSHSGGKKGESGITFNSTWTFDEIGDGKTRLTLRHVFPTVEERDKVVRDFGAIEGGKQCLGRLSEFLARKT